VRLIPSGFVADNDDGQTSGLFGTFEKMTFDFEIRSQASCAQGPVELMVDLELCISQVKVVYVNFVLNLSTSQGQGH
jgi:hypothetical protein